MKKTKTKRAAPKTTRSRFKVTNPPTVLQRVCISIPAPTKVKLARAAAKAKISQSQFVRDALAGYVR